MRRFRVTLRRVLAMNSTCTIISERQTTLPGCGRHLDTISMLCRELAELHFPEHAEALMASALEREALEATYVGRGLAVPHARVEGLPAAAVYVAQCESGIPWPQEAADTVVLLAVPAEQPDLYLQLLGKLMRWRMKGLNCADLRALLA